MLGLRFIRANTIGELKRGEASLPNLFPLSLIGEGD